jgi:hypothetical protein
VFEHLRLDFVDYASGPDRKGIAAEDKVASMLGGISSPAGSCVWHVVGLQRSVREWAMRQGWGGRPVRQERAQGILVAALGTLAHHQGSRSSARSRQSA